MAVEAIKGMRTLSEFSAARGRRLLRTLFQQILLPRHLANVTIWSDVSPAQSERFTFPLHRGSHHLTVTWQQRRAATASAPNLCLIHRRPILQQECHDTLTVAGRNGSLAPWPVILFSQCAPLAAVAASLTLWR